MLTLAALGFARQFRRKNQYNQPSPPPRDDSTAASRLNTMNCVREARLANWNACDRSNVSFEESFDEVSCSRDSILFLIDNRQPLGRRRKIWLI